MSANPSHLSPIARQRKGALIVLAMAGVSSCALLAAGLVGGIRFNTTPSAALGIWRVIALDRPVRVGDLVFVCPPDTTASLEGVARRYLRPGLCPGGYGPLIKTVIATGGQRVEIDEHVMVDGVKIAHSGVVESDGRGRSLRSYQGGVIRQGEVFLHAAFTGSWDSRYFGPVPENGILGLAAKVLVHER